MGRYKPSHHLTSEETWKQVNPENKKLLKEFIQYMHATNHSDKTCSVYETDLKIIMTWILQECDNKHFTELKKKDLVRFNFYITNELHQSPARASSLKSVISSLSRYIERVCDDEYPDFRNISFVIDIGAKQPVWDKNIITKEDVALAVKTFTEREEYQEACLIALIFFSGMRVSEVLQTRVDDFTDKHLVFKGKVYLTHTMRTKGRGKQGKQIGRYVFAEFKPYYDAWMKQREKLGIDSELLFVNKPKSKNHGPLTSEGIRNTVSVKMAKIVGHPCNPHALRHTMVTEKIRDGWSQEVMKDLIQWESIDMVSVYNDASKTENLEKFFGQLDNDNKIN